MDALENAARLLYQSGLVGAILTAVFAFVIARRLERFKQGIQKDIASYNTELLRNLEIYKLDLNKQLELFKVSMSRVSGVEQKKLEACHELSQLIEQASSLVDIGDTMLTAGLVQPMSDQVAKPLLAIAGLVWKWLDTNRFYFPDDAIHATAYAYFGEIGLFSGILERPSSVTVEQRQHVKNQLYQTRDALRSLLKAVLPSISGPPEPAA